MCGSSCKFALTAKNKICAGPSNEGLYHQFVRTVFGKDSWDFLAKLHRKWIDLGGAVRRRPHFFSASASVTSWFSFIRPIASERLSINLPEYDVERAEDRRDIGEHVATGQEIHR